MEVTTLIKPSESNKFNLVTIIVVIDIIGFIIYGIAMMYKSFFSDINKLVWYIIENNNIIANAYLPYSIADILFISISIFAYIILGFLLIKRNKIFNITFTVVQIITVFLYCFKYILLINSTMYAVTAGDIKTVAFSDFNFLINEMTRNTTYIYSSVFLILMSIMLIIYIWKSKYFKSFKHKG